MKKAQGIRSALLAAGLAAASLAHGVVLVDQTSTLGPGDPTFNRTNASGGTCIGDAGSGFFYKTFTFTAAAGAPLNVRLSGIEGKVALDTFVDVYTPSFDPASPLTNCVGANDDSNSLNSFVQIAAPAAGSYTVVATSFSPGASGDFRVCVTQGADELALCLETAPTIPTLSEWALGGLVALLGAASAFAIRRRRSRAA